jgi:hypothetical protein
MRVGAAGPLKDAVVAAKEPFAQETSRAGKRNPYDERPSGACGSTKIFLESSDSSCDLG